jgi:hypothetical protein
MRLAFPPNRLTFVPMPSLTIKLPESLRQKLESTARISGRSVSAVVRDAIDASLPPAPGALSLFERTRDLCGKGKSGIPDLATNAKHMKGYGA